MRANLSSANLQGAILPVAQLLGAILWNARLQGTILLGAQLQGANLLGAQLQGANLQQAKLQVAILPGAQLQGADLKGAQLQGTDLKGTRLQGANLTATQLQGVFSEEATGFNSFQEQLKARTGKAAEANTVRLQGMTQDECDDIAELINLIDFEVSHWDMNDYTKLVKAELSTFLEKLKKEHVGLEDISPQEKLNFLENQGADIGSYTQEDAEKWIADKQVHPIYF